MPEPKTHSRLTRRQFLIAGAGAAAWVGACNGPVGPAAGPPEVCPGPDGWSPSGTASTPGDITEANAKGPFYMPDSPHQTSLREPDMEGTPLRVSGRVLTPEWDPITQVMLEFWQANGGGKYDNAGFTLRGHQFSGGDGAYLLDTIVPGAYRTGTTYRPAHIHVTVTADGFSPLTTQLYFPCDVYSPSDSFILPSLIMPVEVKADGSQEAVFDFVLAPA